MYRKQLQIIALKSSPTLALFAMSPAFMLTETPKSLLIFFLSFVIALMIILVVWEVNIIIISIFESRKSHNNWQKYLLSYLFITALSSVVLLALILNTIQTKPLPLTFNIVNTFGINAIILVICNTIILQHKNTQTEKELANLRIENLESEQQQLINQLQPHFIFNALGTLKSLIRVDAELAELYLIKLSDFLRVTITFHKKQLVPLSEELQFTSNYIELQHIRFSGSLSHSINIHSDKINTYSLPIYALQTLVENAIKHNALSEETPLYINITIHEDHINISNNRIPKYDINKGGVGLQNLNKRYLLTCGEEIHITETLDQFEVKIKLLNTNINA